MEKLTAESFKEKVFDYAQNEEWSFNGEKPAIIDFYANWCGPCKTIAPILEELDTEFEDVDFYKVDTEVEKELASTFGIQSIPSILFVPLEGSPHMALGALSKETFKQAIGDVLFPKIPDEGSVNAEKAKEDKEEETK
jgi:thioredoxin